MPIDSSIPLQARMPDFANAVNQSVGNYQAILQRKQEQPLRQQLLQGEVDAQKQQTEYQKAQLDSLRNNDQIKGGVYASLQAKNLVDANDIPGAIAFATDRINNITARGGDPTHTAKVLQLLQSGDPTSIVQAKALLNNEVQMGKQIGILKADENEHNSPGFNDAKAILGARGILPSNPDYSTQLQSTMASMQPGAVITPYQQQQLDISRAQLDISRQNANNKPGQVVQTDQGTVIVDPRNSTSTPVLDQNGKPISGRAGALTESQGNATGFGMRASEANKILIDLAQSGVNTPSKIKDAVSSVPLIGSTLGAVANATVASPKQQQAEQAQRDFVNAILRKESGAAISSSEFDNAKRQYFPAIGDSKEVIDQKRANRETAIDALRIQAGPGGKNIPTNYTNKKGWILHTDANGNRAYVSPDGKQFEEVK